LQRRKGVEEIKIISMANGYIGKAISDGKTAKRILLGCCSIPNKKVCKKKKFSMHT
jgi:hypothetical protein